MARPIEHNPDKVLTQAMHIFWEKGYEQTSIQDIVAVTGLKPGSIYNIYGNKEGLFQAVLNLYSTDALHVAKNILFKESNPLLNLENFLYEVVIASIANETTHGCLMVKTLLVISHKDNKIQANITQIFDKVEKYLVKVLESLVEEEKTNVSPNDFARLIIITLYGSHVYYKTHQDTVLLKDSVKAILNAIT